MATIRLTGVWLFCLPRAGGDGRAAMSCLLDFMSAMPSISHEMMRRRGTNEERRDAIPGRDAFSFSPDPLLPALVGLLA